MSVNQRSRFGRTEQVSSVVASIVGAVLAGVVIQAVGGTGAMEQFARLVGADTLTVGWAVWLAQGLVFGVGFALVLARTVNKFTDVVISVSQQSRLTRALLVPLLRRSALAVTAGTMGLIYGQFVLAPLFSYLAPFVLVAQGNSALLPLTALPVVLGYIVYGTVLGTTYGLLLSTPWFDTNRIGEEHTAALAGAVAGGIAGTAVLAAVGGTDLLATLGGLTGTATVRRGVLLFGGAALVLGLAFAWVLARTINDFTTTVIMVSRRSKLTQKLLVPLLMRAALTVTAGSMGLVYGLVLGVAAVGLGAAGVLPQTGLAGLLAFTVYGNVLGYGYGLMMEDVDLPALGPSEEQRAGLLGSVGAGLLSAGVLALVLGPSVFESFAALVGAGSLDSVKTLVGSVEPVAGYVGVVDPVVGLGLWMAAALVFGLAFSWVLSRTINDFTTTVIMVSRRSELTQKILVPLLMRAALTITAGSMGLVYGLVLGGAVVGLGAVGVLPQTGLAGLLAGVVYGNVLGYGYGLVMEDVDLSGLGPSEEQRAGLLGSVGAGLLSAGVLTLLAGRSTFATLAGAVESADPLVGASLWMAVSLVFGLVFVAYVSRTVNDFTTTVIMVSRRSELTQKILVPLLMRAALTITAGSMGLVYGLVLGIAVYGGVLAGLLPQLSPLVVVAAAIYGQVLGTSYGLLLEDVDLSLPAVFRRDDDQESVSLIEYDSDWRPRRPATGGLSLLGSGLVVAAIPLQQQLTGAAPGPSPDALGIVIGAMLVACGIFALVKPQLSTLVGVTAVGLSMTSIVSVFGGLFVGMVLGLVGGSLCLVWEDPKKVDPTGDYGFIRIGDPERSSGD